jgi:hypothetical protein
MLKLQGLKWSFETFGGAQQLLVLKIINNMNQKLEKLWNKAFNNKSAFQFLTTSLVRILLLALVLSDIINWLFDQKSKKKRHHHMCNMAVKVKEINFKFTDFPMSSS